MRKRRNSRCESPGTLRSWGFSLAYPIETFGSAPFKIIDGDRGKAYPKQSGFRPSGYCLFLSATNVTKAGFDFGSGQFIDEQKDVQLRKGKLQREDVVLTTRGTLGNVAHYNTHVPFEHVRINSGMVILRCDQSKILPRYLYAYLRSGLFRGQVERMRSGVAQPQLPIRDMKWIEIPLPTPLQQERLVEIFSAYDDLIENNRRRIALLEEAARLLYREWFVHFRFPGHEHVKIVDGIPEGWQRRTIEDVTAFLRRGISPSYDDEAEYLVVNQKCVRNRMLAMAPARRQKKEFKPEKALRCLDVLINSTGTGTLGRVAQCWFEPSNTTFDSHVTVARPIDAVDPYWFGYAMLELESVFEGMGDGATNQKELGRARIADTCIIAPKHALQRNFGAFASDTAKQIQVLVDQNQKLVDTRDLLLPRLMNGEIAV